MPSRVYTSATSEDWDPLAKAISPPPDETLAEKEARVKTEQEAKRVSDAIDDDLDRQRNAEKRGPKPVRVLLLGQSESGKSTTLKNFQLMQDAKAFRAERGSWRALIQLNVIRSIHIILDAIARSYYPSTRSPTKSPSSSTTSPSTSPPELQVPLPVEPYALDPELLELRLRLNPLLQVEQQLTRRLVVSDPTETEPTIFPNGPEKPRQVGREVAVNSAMPWKDVFGKLVPSKRQSLSSEDIIDWDDPNDPGRVLHECAGDMKRLWNHPSVQELLDKQNLRLEEMAGFFLDELDEVTSERYIPTNAHILKARIKTLGVSEHRITMNTGGGLGRDWRIYDVGGHRSLVTAWVPYFDNMNAIIFLAPISAFDQVLAEAPKVNRLEDSVMLWQNIVSNKLLQNTDIILFLNKCDLFASKLASGIKLRDYVVSYGNRPNDIENASSYLRKKFAGIMKEDSPLPRTFYCHLTTVTDTKSTQKVITSIKDMLMRDSLKDSTLLL
ncbi:guanine nucleotide-binding protein alpha-4 subunit [Moniliophthora roreri MCA 2997]|uniref:Guanine nucleotide-binding protein alpha-4 subunit n=1 Tax=Moniliophthora roreri (strain MCA 2997) TaxID=1381753 RepID=V2X245_MONRO|nr:guanine nucleotide-binding protein alpha-4 subunit [Moniliophthora roreri MCA 2997]